MIQNMLKKDDWTVTLLYCDLHRQISSLFRALGYILQFTSIHPGALMCAPPKSQLCGVKICGAMCRTLIGSLVATVDPNNAEPNQN